MKKTIAFLILFLMVSIPCNAIAVSGSGVLLTASSGSGKIYLFWYAPVEDWPENGWRLSDTKGHVLADQILPLSPQSRELLQPDQTTDQAESIKNFLEGIEKARTSSKEDRQAFNAVFALNILSSFEKAKAMGLAWQLMDVKPGPVQYQVTGLDKNKKSTGLRLVSEKIDAAKATPLPPSPKGLKTIPDIKGATLFWAPVPASDTRPVLTYEIERIARDKNLSDTFTVVKGMSWKPELPAFVDTGAPVEKALTYKVSAVDCFGRKSSPAVSQIFMPDMMTLAVPDKIKTKSKNDRITLSWETLARSKPSGFLVERSAGSKGLYQVLTPKGLEPDSRSYTDKTVIPGVYYYYRVRAVGSDGTLGEATQPVMVKTAGSGPPPRPARISAKVNPILITLSWAKPETPVAGYIVERRSKGSDQWARRNDILVRPPVYKDHLKPGTYGTFYYRVTAVGLDDLKSKPSKEIKAELEDRSAPAQPVITSIDGSSGKVTLSFEPGRGPGIKNPEMITYTVLRDLPSRKQGQIIKQDIPGSTRQFIDDSAVPGQGYWYAVVARDTRGKESPWSEKHLVRVLAPSVPKAEKPSLSAKSTPFSHVVISFNPPPEKLLVAVQRKDREDAPWMTLVQGIKGSRKAVDTNPVQTGTAWYRIVYQGMDGTRGEPSDPVKLKR